MIRKLFTISCVLLLFVGSTGCGKHDEVIKIDLTKREKIPKESQTLPNNAPIRIAIGSVITPKEGYIYYKKFLSYIGKKLNRPVQSIDRGSYEEVNEMVASKKVDVAFVCGQPYVDGHRDFGMEILVAPYAYGGTVYYAYIIVNKNSSIENFDQLRGKTFAFTDPMSNTGKLVPTYMLAKKGESPDKFFEKYVYTYAHDKSIKAVAHGLVDGAAVDSLIWEHIDGVDPEHTSATKVIERSPPFGIPPVVVHPELDPELKEKLRQIFLNVHKDPEGRSILKGMMVDKFVLLDDSAYDSIREMEAFISKKQES